jgi:hypothetical protein
MLLMVGVGAILPGDARIILLVGSGDDDEKIGFC